MKKYLPIIVAMIMTITLVGLTGCGSGNSGSSGNDSEPLTKDEVQEFNENSNEAYIKLLEEHSKAIKEYTWQSANAETFKQNLKPVVLEDINGDGVTDLLFFEKSDKDKPIASMSIYTYGKDGLTEMPYEFGKGKLTDNAQGAGDCYVVYKGSKGRFYIYKSRGETEFVATVESYVFNGNSLVREYSIKMTETIITDDKSMFLGFDTTYEKDGKVADTSKAEKEYSSAINDLSSVLISSGYDGTEIYKKFNPSDDACMSLDEAIKTLSDR